MGRFPWQCDSRWLGTWLYVVMGANQFVLLLVFGVRKPWFHPVAYCCGVLLLTPAQELLSDVEGNTPTPWSSARLPRFSSLVGWACFSFTPHRLPPPPRAGWEVTVIALSQGPVMWKRCPRLALSVKHPYIHPNLLRADVGTEPALTSWGGSKGP